MLDNLLQLLAIAELLDRGTLVQAELEALRARLDPLAGGRQFEHDATFELVRLGVDEQLAEALGITPDLLPGRAVWCADDAR